MCNACSRYEKQNLFIENNIKYLNYMSQREVDVEQLKHSIREKLAN